MRKMIIGFILCAVFGGLTPTFAAPEDSRNAQIVLNEEGEETLLVLQNADIREVLRLIAEVYDLNIVMNEYYKNLFDQDTLRYLAINDPWSSEWSALKASGKIFHNSHLTLEQKSLISLSCMYDKIYESPDCPTDEVIQDHDTLDGWLILQRKRNEKEKRKREIESSFGISNKMDNADEIFLPAQTEEDAKRIYDLNDQRSANIVHQRLSKLKNNKIMKHQDFDDVKQDIIMEATRSYSNKMKGGR